MNKETIKWIHLEETDSTNQWAKDNTSELGKKVTVVSTDFQTAGRGCGKNHWESENGKNLTFSIIIYPLQVKAQEQYILLMAESLALKDCLSKLCEGFTIKWPNDIYYKDSKISGTLSECTLHEAMVRRCILGTGLNVNQQLFTSDAPNPISIYQIIGAETDRKNLLHHILEQFEYYHSLLNRHEYATIQQHYQKSLYRKDGTYTYRDKEGLFQASIVCVEPDGHLVLRDSGGRQRRYAFKEVQFIIPEINK